MVSKAWDSAAIESFCCRALTHLRLAQVPTFWVFQIAKEVPKGALLHLHFNTEVHPERLLKKAESRKDMYVWSKRSLRSEEDLVT